MFKIALKGLIARRRRFISTILAVVLGVGFLTGVSVFTNSINDAFNGLFASVYKGTDAIVRSSATVKDEFGTETRPRVPDSLVATIKGVDGVADAEGDVTGEAFIVGSNGKSLNNGRGAPSIGAIWSRIPQFHSFTIVQGTPPANDNEVAIDRGSYKTGKLTVGQPVTIITKAGSTKYTLVGVVTFGGQDSPLGANSVIFTPAEGQRQMATAGEFTNINVLAKPGVSQTTVKASIAKVLPAKTQVLTGAEIIAENQSSLKSALSFITSFLTVFALIAVVVGAFVIANTFTILVSQRTKELALLRALGASRRQITNSVVLEAALIGVIGAALGIAAGFAFALGIKGLFSTIGFTLPSTSWSLQPSAIVTAFAVGVVTTVVVAYNPARHASKVPPVAAMRDVAIDTSASRRSRRVLGAVLAAISVAALASSISNGKVPVFAVGMAALLIAVIALGPAIARPIARGLGWPIEKIKNVVGHLARQNAARNPRRTASSALALMIGALLVSLIAILAQSLKSSINHVIDKSLKSDFVVQTTIGLPPTVVDQLRALPQVDSLVALRIGNAKIDGGTERIIGTDLKKLGSALDLGISQGSFNDMGIDGIAVDKTVMKDKHWVLGQKIPTSFTQSDTTELTIKAVYADSDAIRGTSYVLDLAAFTPRFPDSLDRSILINRKAGVSAEAGRAALDTALKDYPTATVLDQAGFKDRAASNINSILALVFGLLAFAVIIALFGIANTLSLSINERTRELGLLRAVGMSRRQMRSAVRWEAVIIAVFGALLGVILGVFGGWAVLRVLAKDSFVSFSLPVGQVILVLVVAGVAGVAAALRPAHRASKLDVLQAIATE